MTRPYIRSSITTVEPLADCRDHGDQEVMQALASAGALVARAGGRIDAVERNESVNFADRQRLVPTIPAQEIAAAFDSSRRQLENRTLMWLLKPFVRWQVYHWHPPWFAPQSSLLPRICKFILARDLQIHFGELKALKLIRQIIITVSVRQAAIWSYAPLAEAMSSIAVAGSASIAITGAVILPVMNELARRTASPKIIDVSSSNNDNYLELFASGPGRGWYVLGKAREALPMKAPGSDRDSEPEIGAHDNGREVTPEIVDGVQCRPRPEESNHSAPHQSAEIGSPEHCQPIAGDRQPSSFR